MDRRGGSFRSRDRGRSRFCARPYRPRPHPYLLSAGRRRAEEGSNWRANSSRRHGSERERTHVETLALAVEGQIPAALASALAHLEAHPRDAIVMSLPMGAFGLFAFSGMADHDQARVDLCRTLRASLWRRLVVPHQSRLGADRERRRQARPRHDRARLRHAQGQRQRGACAAARDVRGRLGGRCRRAGQGVDPDLRPLAASCTAISSGTRRSARSSMAMRRGRLRSTPRCCRPSATRAPPLNAVTDGASLLWRLQAYGHAVLERSVGRGGCVRAARVPEIEHSFCRRPHGAVRGGDPQSGGAGRAPCRDREAARPKASCRRDRWCRRSFAR